ncbi:VWA domain-containing protein [Planotetraspora sp. GP83]|uniref:VWA domain-containing protein n=1 Tax=Planotetraspora sp. GP83 TaxID=3156264 RepID=UPI003512F5C4
MSLTGRLKDLTARAGQWLGLAATPTPAPAALHTLVVEHDKLDAMTWADTWEQATALRDLADSLNDNFDHTGDLVRDTWTAAFKATPRLRDRDRVDPSRHVNHEVVRALRDAPAFTELRRLSVGDPYTAAMAVLAQSKELRGMLERSKQAAQAAQAAQEAREQAAQAAEQLRQALEDAQAAAQAAGDGDAQGDGNGEGAAGEAADRLEQALTTAQAAADAAQQAGQQEAQAFAQAAPALRQAARAAAKQAADAAETELAAVAAWGLGPGELQHMSFAERAQLAEALTRHRLAKYVDLIGRFRQMATGERARKVDHARGELVGVTLGDEVPRLVPGELAALADPGLRADFAARLAERRLMVYNTRGDAPAGQGPIICLVDCSGSMLHEENGISREAWAKACALALLDQARQARRHFVGVLFSSAGQVRDFHFERGRGPIADVLEFGSHFFDGGTSFQEPLDLASTILDESWDRDDLRHGDVVLITDGLCRVEPEWADGWRQRKAAIGYRLYGVTVQARPSRTLEELCDNVRTVDELADLDTPRELFRLI